MLHSLLVTATDLDRWADLLEGKATFPELLRRLILATAPTLTSVSFESAEGVQLGGWDGLSNADQSTAFVPAGSVGWELGTNQDRKGKADDDYDKRTADPLGLHPAASTFIFCTPRRWGPKESWATTRQAEGHWRDVRVYDANDLATWLAEAPAVHIWLSTLLRKRPAGVTDLETYWQDWAAVTTPPVPASLLLAGHAPTTEALQSWLTNPTRSFSLLADTRQEALAILAAATLALPETERLAVLARAVVVDSLTAWQELVATSQALLLIPLFRNDEAVAGAIRQGHHVFLPLDRTDDTRSAHQPLRLDRQAATTILQAAGIPVNRAETLAIIARRSLAAFRRHRSLTSYATTAPPWATATNAPILLAAAFAGAWDENEQQAAADKEVVAALAGLTYNQLRAQLLQLANAPEPPVRLVGSTWYVVDKADLWALLSHYQAPDLLDRFTDAALQVLGTPLPRYDLPADQQMWANFYGKSSPNSTRLRREVADSLAFLGAEVSAPSAVVALVPRAVRELMRRANQQANVWSSLANYLPQLAEAAPDEFLAGVSAGLQGDPPPIMALFEERAALTHRTAEHPGLLSALELLAWHPAHLTYAARLLAQLAQLDPGGSIYNRPKNSLRELFLPWMPHTTATLTQRMTAIDNIRRAVPEVAWVLLLGLLPNNHTVSHATRQPTWRDWAPAERPTGIAYAVLYPALEAVADRVVQDAGIDPTRWALLIPEIPDLFPKQRTQAIQQLQQFATTVSAEDQRVVLSEKLRKLIHLQRSITRKDGALPSAEVVLLEAAYYSLLPVEPVNRYAWLFDAWPSLLSGERYRRNTSEQEYERKIKSARQTALDTLLAEGGLDTVMQLMPQVKAPGTLGAAVGDRADVTKTQKDELLALYLGSSDFHEFHFARALAIEYRLTHSAPWEWATVEVHRQQINWTPVQQAAWLDTFPDSPQTWALASELGPETEKQFWLLTSPYGIKSENAPQAFAAFLRHGRPLAAVHVLHLHQKISVSTNDLTTALEEVMELPAGSEPQLHTSADELINMVARLADEPDADSSRVARLEFTLLATHRGERQQAKMLYRELAANPNFFAEVLRMYTFSVARTDLPTAEGTSCMNAYQLLHGWNTIPGLASDGTADSAYLIAWVRSAQQAVTAIDRAIIGEEIIGEMLSSAPVGADGIWPHEIVRDTLEAVENENIERGFRMGKRNGRGVTIRSAFTGGDQERTIAAHFNTNALSIAPNWPRTAACLRNLAQGYTHDAEREDIEANLDQDFR